MGRFLLLLLAGAVLASITLYAGRPDLEAASTAREDQSAALAREVADGAHAAAIGDMIDPATGRFRASLSIPTDFTFANGRAHLDGYRLEDDNQVAVITVTGYAAGVAHRVTSRYRLGLSDFPGPLWVDAPVASAAIDPKAVIDGTTPGRPTRPAYFDATRFNAYRLASSIPLASMESALSAQVARGGASLSIQAPMDPVLAATGTPTLSELRDKALTVFGTGDVLKTGATTITGTEAYGNFNNASVPDPHIVRVTGPLTVAAGATLSGNGLLLVEGNLTVAGTLRWDGLVLVVPPTQLARVVTPGTVQIRGSLMVNQEAPPPGGHTDLTVNRSLSGAWPTAAGRAGQYAWALRHTHRIEATIPDRTFHFAEAASNRHEGVTRFEETLDSLGTSRVYLRFKNPVNNGASRVTLRLAGVDYGGSVSAGFPAGLARAGDPQATHSFAPRDLTDLTVEVRSLRLLAHLTNGEVSGVLPGMEAWMNGGRCDNRPACVGQLWDRDGALALEVVRENNPSDPDDDQVVYDASIYWHTKEPGHSENKAEEAADAAWRASLAAGAGYGTRLELGPQTSLSFSVPRMTPIAARLGLSGSAVVHEGSRSRHWVIGESASSSATGTASGVAVCAAGATVTLTAEAARAAIRRGATLGAC